MVKSFPVIDFYNVHGHFSKPSGLYKTQLYYQERIFVAAFIVEILMGHKSSWWHLNNGLSNSITLRGGVIERSINIRIATRSAMVTVRNITVKGVFVYFVQIPTKWNDLMVLEWRAEKDIWIYEGWQKKERRSLHGSKPHNLWFSPNFTGIIKSCLGWTGHVAHWGNENWF